MDRSAPSPPRFLLCVRQAQVPVSSLASRRLGSFSSQGRPGGAELGATVQYPSAPSTAFLTAPENPGCPNPDPPWGTCEHQLPTKALRGLDALGEIGAHLSQSLPHPRSAAPPAAPDSISGVPGQSSTVNPIRGHRPPPGPHFSLALPTPFKMQSSHCWENLPTAETHPTKTRGLSKGGRGRTEYTLGPPTPAHTPNKKLVPSSLATGDSVAAASPSCSESEEF